LFVTGMYRTRVGLVTRSFRNCQ